MKGCRAIDDDESKFPLAPAQKSCSEDLLNIFGPDVNEYTEPVDFDSDDSVKDPDYHTDEDIGNNQFYTAVVESEEEENSEDTNVFNNDQEQQTENSEPDAAVQKKRTRKDKQINKELRNKGKSYVSEKGKEVKARDMLPLKPCRMKCLEKFIEEDSQKCFEEYWAIGNHDNRVRYISSLITISKPKTHRVVEDNAKLREIVCKYEIIIQGNNQPICRECYLRTFGETTGFIERVASKKKESFSGIIAPDGRGKFAPVNKTKMEDLQSAESHILSFPSYESHYCRNRNSKRFLSSDLNISKICFHELDLEFKNLNKTLVTNVMY
ncbi:hypothetical protein ANN_13794 [Periplaneta americana]|uniref:Uncharacterized protein n=1 Tax=Periplaneta americana TaxID=6978 RepID=A0ABQ8SVU1_PERAM|nr:hypothetical protein ANN_13794 [Periplaneta americana]